MSPLAEIKTCIPAHGRTRVFRGCLGDDSDGDQRRPDALGALPLAFSWAPGARAMPFASEHSRPSSPDHRRGRIAPALPLSLDPRHLFGRRSVAVNIPEQREQPLQFPLGLSSLDRRTVRARREAGRRAHLHSSNRPTDHPLHVSDCQGTA